MNDYLILPIIFIMILLFFFNFMIVDTKFHKSEMRDISHTHQLERIQRELERIKDDIRRKE